MAVERVEGVARAGFSYDRAEGFVSYDPNVTSPRELIAELERLTDFSATVREVGAGSGAEATGAAGHEEEETEDGEHR